jgi:hypothetical protein
MRSLLLIVVTSFVLPASGQFSSDPLQFIKDVDKILGEINRPTTKTFLEQFEPNWLTNFSGSNQQKVVSTCNLILAKGLSPFPDVYGYLLSVHSFVQTNQPTESFESWHNTIDELLNSKNVRKFQEFIKVCSGFFSDGTIFDFGNHLWRVRGGTYKFIFAKGQPIIEFNNVTLGCYIVNRSADDKKDIQYFDSTVVRGTSGLLEPLAEKWTGKGGIVDWAKVGLDPRTNFAQITDYSMSLKSTEFESDTATVYTQYYSEPLQGKFRDMAKKTNREIDKDHPQFTSFSRQVVRKNILPEVDYVGGFGIEGAYFSGMGYSDQAASLIFYKDQKPFIKASALRFIVGANGARANECEIVIYVNELDSIYHPGLNMIYDLKKMDLARDKEGMAQAPFNNSYHDLDMYVDKLVWRKGDPNLSLEWQDLATRKIARFESKNYFSEKVYTEIQGMNTINPLAAIYNYAYKYDLEVIKLSDAATCMNFTVEQAIPIILDLANRGFITYNRNKKIVIPQPKLKQYVNARAGKSDYDNIVIYSNLLEIEKRPEVAPDGHTDKQALVWNERADSLNKRKSKVPNFGVINLETLDLALNEVDPIEISPEQNVVIFPNSDGMVVKQDLDMLFAGAVMAGKTEFYLNEASFDYEQFRINLLECTAALLRVKPIYGGSDKLVPMYSHFEGLHGHISIDDPTNRAGIKQKRYPNYPILESSRESYVFYDHKAVFNSVYDSARFYFKCDPFSFDSLDNFDEYSVAFDGELRSAGIFPVFREKLKIQEDYSFGFKTVAPAGGFNFYGAGAKFDKEIKLSNEGLRGAGEIDFVTSHSVSENFIFFPDSTMGLSKYTNRGQTSAEGVEVPDVVCDGAMVTYVPKQQILKARSEKAPLLFFNKEADMRGITYLTPQGMTGRGLMYFKEAELGSKHFEYKRWLIEADTSDFNLESKGVGDEVDPDGEKNPLSFNTQNVQARVDFEARKGEFKSNEGESKVEFPKNQYICYMDMFTWYMDNDEMELSKTNIEINTDLDLAGSNFYSVHPDQDSLNFAAPKAKFDLKTNTITCQKVEALDVADARIYPPDNQIIIRKKAEMDPFVKAKIEANNVTKYHTITDADVKVTARRAYHASGNYSYIDSKGGEQKIFFGDIRPDTNYQTVAVGEITTDKNFYLSDKFDFYGKAELLASDQFLTFDGATRIKHDCSQFAKNWLKFRAEIDPNNILIPVDKDMKDLEGNSIAVGLVLRTNTIADSIGIYPAFLSALERTDDNIVFTSFGQLNYNEATSEFRIATEEKLINRADTGNYIALNTGSCSMQGDGLIDLCMDIPDVTFEAYGTIAYDNATKETKLNLSGGLDFFYDKRAMQYMSDAILAKTDLSAIDWDRTTMSQAITELDSKEEAENIKGDFTIKGEVKKLPKAMETTMYLTSLRLRWMSKGNIHGFVSQPISGITALYGQPIMKDFTVRFYVDYMVLGERGPWMGIMVEIPGTEENPAKQFYFYRFERLKKDTKLSVTTSDAQLQAYLSTLKEDKLKLNKLEFGLMNDKSAAAAEYRNRFEAPWAE